jgi:hypothetical protein
MHYLRFGLEVYARSTEKVSPPMELTVYLNFEDLEQGLLAYNNSR